MATNTSLSLTSCPKLDFYVNGAGTAPTSSTAGTIAKLFSTTDNKCFINYQIADVSSPIVAGFNALGSATLSTTTGVTLLFFGGTPIVATTINLYWFPAGTPITYANWLVNTTNTITLGVAAAAKYTSILSGYGLD